MTKKPETIDCVIAKRRAQRSLARALAGQSPAEQVATLRRLAVRSRLWRSLVKPRPPEAVRTQGKRRSAG